MGLDATVRCRCWEDGRAAPFERPELVRLGAEGFLELSAPWDEASAALHARFESWLDVCCAHPRTCFAAEWIASWFGVADFRFALKEMDPRRFAALLRELPRYNGGATPPEAAAECLRELDAFESGGPFSRVFRIIDSSSGERLHGSATGEPLLMQGREVEIGADAAGLYVRAPHGRTLFRAFRVEQIDISKRQAGADERGRRFALVDRDSGARVETGMAFSSGHAEPSGEWRPTYPRFVEVRVEPNHPREYAGLIGRLRTVLCASVEIARPVLWT